MKLNLQSQTSVNVSLQMCKAIDDRKAGNNTLEKLYSAANVYYNSTGRATCFNLNDDSDPHGLDEWSWQVSSKK